jgi:hypothetical protein
MNLDNVTLNKYIKTEIRFINCLKKVELNLHPKNINLAFFLKKKKKLVNVSINKGENDILLLLSIKI